ncbi:MAG: NUDIX domain-containing protein [Prevotellaceae bacterium]|jgi:ADP-ribose pyrophosphatase YjhB (NUDIX family)|nr:NUDIX domain-containing protein [Prevotellaceae bacterium]
MLEDFFPSQVFRYCPYCGSDSFAWDGVKSHRCSRCGRKLYTNAAAATIAVIGNPQGELLMTRRGREPSQGMLDLPGGFVDTGETAEHGVMREVKEELNVEVSSLQFLGTFTNQYLYGGTVYFTLDLAFACAVRDLAPLRPADDVSSFVFLALHDIKLEEIAFRSVREVVEGLQRGRIRVAVG